jgi:diaminohydroxyphosphoribosylaminopyrimidine deaminase / 5-amino-6-(5-phosphoribosylamino)uracil reductase
VNARHPDAASSSAAGPREPDGLSALYMRRALELAARGLYSTDPNPRVGCVLVRGGDIVGEGWHERAGEPHAEQQALRAAGPNAQGATAYVTLEPCAHVGRTPPCALALIAARVARVMYASDDPNPLVNGAGAAALRAAGIEVASGVLAAEGQALNPGFFKRMQAGLPWVRVKLGASLDGRTALANGVSRWITGDAAREDVHHFRARSSAILSGSGTVLADDPALTVRLAQSSRQPLRVLLDSDLRVPEGARIYAAEGTALVFTASEDARRRAALERRGVRVEASARAVDGGLALEPILRRLAQLQTNEVWVEAGARLAGALLQARLVDELIVYIAPSLLGPQGRALATLPEISQLEQRLSGQFTDCTRLGEDLRLTFRPAKPSAGEGVPPLA